MKSVYLLWDVHKSPNGDDEKLIDVYLTEQDAEAARVRVHEASGFVGAPEGFTIVNIAFTKTTGRKDM